MGRITHFGELDVYRLAMEAAVRIFELSKGFPAEEGYSLTDPLSDHDLPPQKVGDPRGTRSGDDL